MVADDRIEDKGLPIKTVGIERSDDFKRSGAGRRWKQIIEFRQLFWGQFNFRCAHVFRQAFRVTGLWNDDDIVPGEKPAKRDL